MADSELVFDRIWGLEGEGREFITKPARNSKKCGMTKLASSPQLEHGNDTTGRKEGETYWKERGSRRGYNC